LQNIITFIEEEFGIEVDDDDLKAENFQTVNAMTKLVEGKR
jgi:acyl carrier protein